MSSVAIIDSGVANLASIARALEALGAEVSITSDPAGVKVADGVVLPGVGHFGTGIRELRRRGLDRALLEVVEAGKPLLAICLGLQLLCETSQESPGTEGLGIIEGACRALPAHVRVPHLGWNGVRASAGCRTLVSGNAAFANSYALLEAPSGWSTAWTHHGRPFVAALERRGILACQFHPELSGRYGTELLTRWTRNRPAVPGDTGGDASASPCLTRRVIPCLDVKHGRVVKGVQFQQIRDTGDPAERAGLYEAQGADEIVMLDIAASPENQDTHLGTVRRVRSRMRIPLLVGGGVRSSHDAKALLAAGADKISVNTAAVRRPSLLAELASRFGSQCVVLAIDARRRGDSWEVLVRGGREPVDLDVIRWAREGVETGAGEILLTSWDRDGTRSGCDLELIEAVTSTVRVPVIASGGIGTRQDAADALHAGADAVLAASIFHDDERSVAEVKDFLAGKGYQVRA